VVRAAAGSFWLFLVGTVLAMTGGALGNVLLPSLVKRWFPTRTGLMVGAYSTALSLGGAIAALVPQQIVSRSGPDGWRWAIGIWAGLAIVSAIPWFFVPAQPGSRAAHAAVRMRSLAHSPLAMAMAVFFGVQAMQAYVIVGWVPQYLRDAGMAAAEAGLLLAVNTIITIPINGIVPVLAVRPKLQRPMIVVFLAGYVAGWAGMWAAPLAAPLLWMLLLAIGLGAFPFSLALMGLRARSPETTAALSTVTQGAGYLLAGLGPLLVGVLRGITGGYTGMFVLVLVGVAVLGATGWLVTRQRYVDDEVNRSVPGWSGAVPAELIEAAGAEAPVTVHVREPGGGSPRG
jgi:CP family cyanate transporter-like MFS transporter